MILIGYIFYEGGKLKIGKLYNNYNITSVGIMNRISLGRFPVICNEFIFKNQLNINVIILYILMEKELKKDQNGNNKFTYFLTIRTEQE